MYFTADSLLLKLLTFLILNSYLRAAVKKGNYFLLKIYDWMGYSINYALKLIVCIGGLSMIFQCRLVTNKFRRL